MDADAAVPTCATGCRALTGGVQCFGCVTRPRKFVVVGAAGVVPTCATGCIALAGGVQCFGWVTPPRRFVEAAEVPPTYGTGCRAVAGGVQCFGCVTRVAEAAGLQPHAARAVSAAAEVEDGHPQGRGAGSACDACAGVFGGGTARDGRVGAMGANLS